MELLVPPSTPLFLFFLDLRTSFVYQKNPDPPKFPQLSDPPEDQRVGSWLWDGHVGWGGVGANAKRFGQGHHNELIISSAAATGGERRSHLHLQCSAETGRQFLFLTESLEQSCQRDFPTSVSDLTWPDPPLYFLSIHVCQLPVRRVCRLVILPMHCSAPENTFIINSKIL